MTALLISTIPDLVYQFQYFTFRDLFELRMKEFKILVPKNSRFLEKNSAFLLVS